jgi:uncharacterized protein YbjT (DUF2867 family)
MKVVVFGALGLLGSAICREFSDHGHQVTTVARSGADLAVDFRFDHTPQALREAVRGADIVVNAVGILLERDGNTYQQVHVDAVDALCKACQQERVARIVHVSALGVGTGLRGAYMASKLAAEQTLAAHAVDYAIVRPGLLMDSASPSTRLFAWLAGLPVIALPGLLYPGASRLAPIALADVARCVVRIAGNPKALRRVIELAGPQTLSYRALLEHLRAAQGKGAALWLPLPWWLMKLTAWLAHRLPQNVVSVDNLRVLQSGCVSERSETARWLGREARVLDQMDLLASPCIPRGERAGYFG